MAPVNLPEGHPWTGSPSTDNECAMRGWTEALLTSGAADLHVSYPPETDLDGAFRAFCHDEQEMIRVKGWTIEGVEILAEPIRVAGGGGNINEDGFHYVNVGNLQSWIEGKDGEDWFVVLPQDAPK